MMFADNLRKSVLQAAVQGQLTEQLPSDGYARDLLKKIRAEKAKLIKAKKIKPATFPPISDDELPFQIPANWCWARLGDVCKFVGGGTPEKRNPEYWNGNIHWATVADIQSNYLDTTELCITPKGLNESSTNVIKKDSIIIATRVGLGKVCYTKIDTAINQDLKGVYLFGNLNYFYALYFFNTMASYIKKNGVGTTVKGVRLSFLENLLFPLPPISEQERIVAKLDKILAEIELLAADECELAELEKNFPRQMKNSLLLAAVQGKLTEQLPSDGYARDLLKKIRAEKSKLIKAKKIKPATFQPISDDELPFKIPTNWCWARLGDVCQMFTGNSISESEKKEKYFGRKIGLDFIATKDISFDNRVNYDNGVKIPSDNKFKVAKCNSVLMCIEGGSAGRKIAIIDRDVCFGNKLCNFNVYQLSSQYLYFYLQSSAFRKLFADKVVGIIGGVGINKLRHIPIPLPPLAEQERIVAKLDELLPLC